MQKDKLNQLVKEFENEEIKFEDLIRLFQHIKNTDAVTKHKLGRKYQEVLYDLMADDLLF